MLARAAVYFFIKIKLFILKVMNKNTDFGKSFSFDVSTKIRAGNNKLSIGENVYLRSNPRGYHAGMPFPTTILLDKEGAECFIGDNCRINGAYLHCQKKLVIGKNSVIASGVHIIDSNGHILNSNNRTKGSDIPADIIIGENVWIGLNSVILKATIIGNNSVVAAGSIVKGEYPANSLIQGNPAKLVKILEIEDENCNSPQGR